ncbi:type II secretion system protein [Lacticaseibacillus camelliae]|nr:type II secretion system protein [Lacticaseibacillus camelliae]
MAKSSGFHSAMTLAEVLVALALLSGLFLIWRPVLDAIRRLPDLTEEMAMLDAESSLAAYMAGSAEFKTVQINSLYYLVPDPAPLKINGQPSYRQLNLEVRLTSSGSYLQGSGTTSGPGTTPLIYNVKKVVYTTVRPGIVRYELYFFHGSRLTGVLNDKTTR